jgi:hypothetical protein
MNLVLASEFIDLLRACLCFPIPLKRIITIPSLSPYLSSREHYSFQKDKRAIREKLYTKQHLLDIGRPGSGKPLYTVFFMQVDLSQVPALSKQITRVSNIIRFSLTKTCQSFQGTSVNFYQTKWLYITAERNLRISDLSFPFPFSR